MRSVGKNCKVSEYDFLQGRIKIVEKRYEEEGVENILKSIRYWHNIIVIFNYRFRNLKDRMDVGDEASKFEFAYGLLQLHAMEVLSQIECALISVIAARRSRLVNTRFQN